MTDKSDYCSEMLNVLLSNYVVISQIKLIGTDFVVSHSVNCFITFSTAASMSSSKLSESDYCIIACTKIVLYISKEK